MDEAGCTGRLPTASSPIQPVLVIAGIVVAHDRLRGLTSDYLELKRHFFPELAPRSGLALDGVLEEIKGNRLRGSVRSTSRRKRRHAIGVLDTFVSILERHEARILGRVWIKGIGREFRGRPVYTSSIQRICEYHQRYMVEQDSVGIVITDNRKEVLNVPVAHSVFTQKNRIAGDPYGRVVEIPTFAHSQCAVGIQMSDVLCSAMLFPLATYGYCLGHVESIHVSSRYEELKTRFGDRLERLQFRYRDNGRWRGGITVSDAIAQRSSVLLFR
ncbi:DUF3800 domain-containing protein [Conexibacter arvalis]|uniref:DUF3800 domain-containing protein n=1 Tax=Conexibacter arvalis TaxID=912552 RepID=A0A840IHX5_9ACTN|nr:hypothetical protein [Conexibacter arvalis]